MPRYLTSTLTVFLVLGLLLAPLSGPALAAGESNRLTEFWTGDATARLAGAQASEVLSVPLSPIAEVQRATLRISGRNSIALLPRSKLGVRFNNATVGQVQLSAQQPAFALEVDIPPELWRPGFNTLELFVAQHAVEACEDPTLPELWSEVDLFRSSLTVETSSRFEARLGDLSGLFHPGIGSETTALLVTPEAAGSGAVFSEALVAIAQTLALRRQYRPLSVEHRVASRLPGDLPELFAADGDDEVPVDARSGSFYLGDRGGFHVLTGTREQLAALLPAGLLGDGTGPGWYMDRTPDLLDADGNVLVRASRRLVVTGDTESEVALAAEALSLTYDQLNDDDSIQLRSVEGVEGRLPAVGALVPGEEYSFAQLGLSSRRLRGDGLFSQAVPVILPPDYYVSENRDAYLYLDFGYGAGVGPGSALNVTVNVQTIGGVPFDVTTGQAFRRYRLTVPARTLKGGRNDVQVEIALRAPLSDEPCSRVASDHLIAHLRASSSIALPEAGAIAQQPDLELLANTGYPFSVPGTDAVATLAVTSEPLVGPALTFAGKLAQQAGIPLPHLRLELSDGRPGDATTALFATSSTLDPALFADLEAAVAATKRLPYRVQNIAYNRLSRLLYGRGQRPLRVAGTLTQDSELGGVAILYAARNPASADDGTLLLFTAESAAVLEERVEGLVEARLWGQLAGDFFAWSDAEDAELAMKVSANYALGEEDDPLLSVRFWLSNNPWYWLVGVVALVFLLSYLVYRMLLRRNEKLSRDWE